MKVQKTNKLAVFLKRNIYYIIMAVCIVAIITMITLALVLTLPSAGAPADDGLAIGAAIPTDEGNSGGTVSAPPPVAESDETVAPIIVVDSPIVFINPVDGSSIIKNYCMTGLVFNSTLNKYEVHDGIDLQAPAGTAVAAVYDGTVENVSYDMLWGYQVTLLHKDEVRSIYKSLQNVCVATGESVVQGAKIGEVSTSAGKEQGDGPHLHLSVTEKGVSADPTAYLVGEGK